MVISGQWPLWILGHYSKTYIRFFGDFIYSDSGGFKVTFLKNSAFYLFFWGFRHFWDIALVLDADVKLLRVVDADLGSLMFHTPSPNLMKSMTMVQFFMLIPNMQFFFWRNFFFDFFRFFSIFFTIRLS